jgi:hypothetical protein
VARDRLGRGRRGRRPVRRARPAGGPPRRPWRSSARPVRRAERPDPRGCRRLSIRLATVAARRSRRPWRVAAAIRAAFRWEPMRAAATPPNELAETFLAAFRRAAEGLARP